MLTYKLQRVTQLNYIALVPRLPTRMSCSFEVKSTAKPTSPPNFSPNLLRQNLQVTLWYRANSRYSTFCMTGTWRHIVPSIHVCLLCPEHQKWFLQHLKLMGNEGEYQGYTPQGILSPQEICMASCTTTNSRYFTAGTNSMAEELYFWPWSDLTSKFHLRSQVSYNINSRIRWSGVG